MSTMSVFSIGSVSIRGQSMGIRIGRRAVSIGVLALGRRVGLWFMAGGGAAPASSALLLESGDALLLESGSKLLLEG